MTEQVRVLRVVVASPSDVAAERERVSRAVEEVNRNSARQRNLRFEVVKWETDCRPGFDPDGPQAVIDSLLKIDECDYLIGVFWKRFGTPVKDARSGTEHEIRKAYESWRKSRRPQILLYFKDQPYSPRSREETDQWGFVLDFRKNFPPEGLWSPFTDTDDFERQVRNHLSTEVQTYPVPTGQVSRPVPAAVIPHPLSTDSAKISHIVPPVGVPSVLRPRAEAIAGLVPTVQLTVVVGDRRESPPETPGDLFAHTSSTRDLTWLFSLGLPKSTVLWNDKVVNATSHESNIPEFVRARDLLIIGSPYCNLMSRLVNQSCLFGFNIDSEAIEWIEHHEAEIRGLERRGERLSGYWKALSGTEASMHLIKLRGNGFLDVIHGQTDVGAYKGQMTDYATVSLCTHPYSPGTRHAVLVGGLHLPGTMASVKQLSDPEFFASRPLGGILKIDIPEGEWYERLIRSEVSWFTPPYTIDEYLEKLDHHLAKLKTGHSGVVWSVERITVKRTLAEHHRARDLQAFLSDHCRPPAATSDG